MVDPHEPPHSSLEDCGFADPCESGTGDERNWPGELEERLRWFEERSSDDLTREVYRRQGWVHSSAFAAGGSAMQGEE